MQGRAGKHWGCSPAVISAEFRWTRSASPTIRRRAVRHLEKKRVCVFYWRAPATPFFHHRVQPRPLRASEMACDAIFYGARNGVDGEGL